MLTKTKIALAATLIAATSSAAFAQFDPNMANRYPGYVSPNASVQTVAPQSFRSAPVGLYQERNVALPQGQQTYSGTQATGYDRASSPYAGGGY